eukprot:CAMPEP_0183711362 /NCGR_PEP_ID=MMETSP0737-20130205/6884_1 /TAXON_ID=385413 /ORGANISM="Thalassiosira miniscula, Strain CCMP1093" /LENGTH=344 /DNA_ID=CAMNT_0025939855 /DNA_START=148 /DNA_END=1182 /DNA_ORIENTATION=-
MASNLLRRAACTNLRPIIAQSVAATTTTATAPISSIIARGYISRAHPEFTVIPSYPVGEAVQTVIDGMGERHLRRAERWEKNKENRVEQRAAYLASRGNAAHPTPDQVRSDAASSAYRRMDETVELAVQLNLDPRKPGQSLRGSLALPHGNGKTFAVAVFTEDMELAQRALEAGAAVAGGASLIESIQNGNTSLSSFQRTLATKDVMPSLSSVARLLGPRGLMPNPKLGTILDGPPEDVLDALSKQMSGMSTYRTDREGIVRLGIGKGSFGPDKLLDNIRETMNELQAIKPETFGKGRKGQKKVAKGTKYYLKAHLSSTQSKGSVMLDLRTIDPTSSFFMSEPQ